jgi:L-iditol 2-dehydrogenase
VKAAILKKIEDLVIEEVKTPSPNDDELVVKVKACTICGTDVKIFHHGHRLISFPRITGHEVSGIIVSKGKNVNGFVEGDRVAVAPAIPCGSCYFCTVGYQTMCDNLTAMAYHYDGGFAEYMLVPKSAIQIGCVNKLPDNVTFEKATLAEPLACVINGYSLSGLKSGDSVLILGAGPIGCLHAELAKNSGASYIMLADVDPNRLKLTEFTECIQIDMSKENIKDKVAEITDNRGADRVMVAAGSHKAQELSLELVSKRGSVNYFGGLPKDKPFINFNSNLVHYGEFFVVGTHGSTPLQNKQALELISSDYITPHRYLTGRFPLEQLSDGLEYAEKNKGLKAVIYTDMEDE